MYNNVRERGGSKGNFLLRDEFSLGSRSLDSGLDTTMKEDERMASPIREVRCTNTWNGEGGKKSGGRERNLFAFQVLDLRSRRGGVRTFRSECMTWICVGGYGKKRNKCNDFSRNERAGFLFLRFHLCKIYWRFTNVFLDVT